MDVDLGRTQHWMNRRSQNPQWQSRFSRLKLLYAVLPVVLACQDAPTRPTPRPLPATAATKDISFGSHDAFPSNATDTTNIGYWMTGDGTLNYCANNFYPFLLNARSSGVDAAANTVAYTSSYLYSSTSDAEEDKPLLQFRPHDNTRESIHIEAYSQDYLCQMNRELDEHWFYNQNGAELGGVSTKIGIYWRAVSYAIGSATLAPWPNWPPFLAGGSVALIGQAYASGAPVTTEIFNQATANWTSSSPDVATIASTGNRITSVDFGEPWGWSSATISMIRAGATTISATVGGAPASYTLHVAPTGSLNHPQNEYNQILDPGWYTWTVTPYGCNSTCTYQWKIEDDGTETVTGYGVGTSQSFYIDGSFPFQFDVIVEVTSNGEMSQVVARNIYNYTGCQSHGGC